VDRPFIRLDRQVLFDDHPVARSALVEGLDQDVAIGNDVLGLRYRALGLELDIAAGVDTGSLFAVEAAVDDAADVDCATIVDDEVAGRGPAFDGFGLGGDRLRVLADMAVRKQPDLARRDVDAVSAAIAIVNAATRCRDVGGADLAARARADTDRVQAEVAKGLNDVGIIARAADRQCAGPPSA
jgi:hypothetical protein